MKVNSLTLPRDEWFDLTWTYNCTALDIQLYIQLYSSPVPDTGRPCWPDLELSQANMKQMISKCKLLINEWVLCEGLATCWNMVVQHSDSTSAYMLL